MTLKWEEKHFPLALFPTKQVDDGEGGMTG